MGYNPAFAEIKTNMQTTATLTKSCSLSASPMDFGVIKPAPTGVTNITGTITSICSKGSYPFISINGGQSGDYRDRKMVGNNSNNTDNLSYNIYVDSGGYVIFGDETNSGTALSGKGIYRDLIIYGKIPLNQYVRPDIYTDNLIVTFAY